MSLLTALPVFVLCGIVIAIAGTYLTKTADQFADISGWGEAIVGALLLGAVTSLSGIVTSVTAAHAGNAQLSVSNAIGGILAQTAFLAIADVFYKKANLEHASASMSNMMQVVLLLIMLAVLLIIMNLPEVNILGVHPGSFLLIFIYWIGYRKISKAGEHPMWTPRRTMDTVEDTPDDDNIKNLSFKVVLLKFILLAAVVAFSGYWVAQSGMVIAEKSGISASFVGIALTAVVTSLPELIVSVSAVRQKALTLAVSNIVGGNSFDLLFISFSDLAFLEGSILHYVSHSEPFVLSLTLLLSGILLLGLLDREKQGLGKIGWESTLILALSLAGYIVLFYL